MFVNDFVNIGPEKTLNDLTILKVNPGKKPKFPSDFVDFVCEWLKNECQKWQILWKESFLLSVFIFVSPISGQFCQSIETENLFEIVYFWVSKSY